MNFERADALNEAIRTIGIRHRARAISALAPLGIHPGHKLLLFELASAGPSTQAELAVACGYEPPTITLSVRQLESAGLVVRRASPTDGRVTVVELSDDGRQLLPKVRAVWRRLAVDTVAGLAEASVAEVLDVLVDLASSLVALDGPAEPVPVRSSRTQPGP
jgi:DNA-binding MarR family transcriptional regulator